MMRLTELTPDQIQKLNAFWRGSCARKNKAKTDQHELKTNAPTDRRRAGYKAAMLDAQKCEGIAHGQIDAFERVVAILFGDPNEVIDYVVTEAAKLPSFESDAVEA